MKLKGILKPLCSLFLILILSVFILAAPLNICGFETQTLSDEISTTGGTTPTLSTTTVRTGTRAVRCNATTTSTSWLDLRGFDGTGIGANFSLGTAFYRFYFLAATLPASGSEPIAQARSSGGVKLEVRVTSTGKLQVYDTTEINQLGSDGTTTLSTGTWYRIDISAANGTSAAYEVRINGTTELSGTGDLGATNNSALRLGKAVDRNGNTVDFFYDDISLNDTAFAPAGAVKAITVTGNGSTMQWTDSEAGPGSGDFTKVDEIPFSTADYVLSLTTADGTPDVALFALQDTAAVGITGTVNAVKGIIRPSEDSTTTSSNAIRLRSSSSNSDSNSANRTTTTLSVSRLLANDPATGTAWTLSGVDGVEVGSVENNDVAMRLSSAVVMVDYTAAASSPGPRRRIIISKADSYQDILDGRSILSFLSSHDERGLLIWVAYSDRSQSLTGCAEYQHPTGGSLQVQSYGVECRESLIRVLTAAADLFGRQTIAELRSFGLDPSKLSEYRRQYLAEPLRTLVPQAERRFELLPKAKAALERVRQET